MNKYGWLLGIVLGWSLAATAQVPFTCQDQFFITLLRNEVSSLSEVIIDPRTTNVVFQSINPSLRFQVNSAGYRSVDNFIYCIDPNERSLIRIDATGSAQRLAYLPLNRTLAFFAGDVSPDGKYLVVIGTANLQAGIEVATELVKVDLEDPAFGVTTVAMNSLVQILDIAFHPRTGDLYGYDSNGRRLVRIDANTGAVQTPFPSITAPAITGTLFFDAYERLFAYGSTNPLTNQNTLYEIDINTGRSKQLTSGPAAVSSDGCSCPYTVKLSKSVTPDTTTNCTDIEYTFRLVNTSRRPQLKLRLEDALPRGFSFVRVQSNPLNGILRSRAGDATFRLDSFDLPSGQHEIKIVVNTGRVRPGIYANQAVLYNLPRSLGSTRVSDDLRTLVEDDSTRVTIMSLPFVARQTSATLCNNAASVLLNAQPYADQLKGTVHFRWGEGANTPTFKASAPGDYTVQLIYGCDTARVTYTVGRSSIDVSLAKDEFAIRLGDSLQLQSKVTNSDRQTRYQWIDPQAGSLRCLNCTNPWARPFNDLRYALIVENEYGCRDSAFAKVTVDRSKSVYFPNVFKPDSGTDNAFFYPSGPNFASIARLSIYSRWGEQMFEARDIPLSSPQNGWNGQYRDRPAQPGVYVWTAEIVLLDGTRFQYEGDVTLVR